MRLTRLLSLFGFILVVVGVAIIGCRLVSLNSAATYTPPVLTAEKQPLLPPFVRLHESNGKFFCSGTVISNKFIATANNCVDRTLFFGPKNFVDTISVRSYDGRDIGVNATVVGGNSRSDTAIITGDFSLFQKRPIVSDIRMSLNYLLANNISLISCGFPWGDRLYCSPITNRAYYNFLVSGNGLLFPGMSGGPVMIAETGEVVAVNTAAMGGQIIISPTGSIFVISGANKNE